MEGGCRAEDARPEQGAPLTPLTPHSVLRYQEGLPAVHLVEMTPTDPPLVEAVPYGETACSS